MKVPHCGSFGRGSAITAAMCDSRALRIDRISERLDRIERRLAIVPAQ